MNDNIHISVPVPAGSDPAEKLAIRAKAFQMGLSIASSSPDFRLQMIMGEAWQKYLELCRWVAEEIQKDESKAEGLEALAKRWAAQPGHFERALPKHMAISIADTKQRMLEEAVVIAFMSPDETPLIEYEDVRSL